MFFENKVAAGLKKISFAGKNRQKKVDKIPQKCYNIF